MESVKKVVLESRHLLHFGDLFQEGGICYGVDSPFDSYVDYEKVVEKVENLQILEVMVVRHFGIEVVIVLKRRMRRMKCSYSEEGDVLLEKHGIDRFEVKRRGRSGLIMLMLGLKDFKMILRVIAAQCGWYKKFMRWITTVRRVDTVQDYSLWEVIENGNSWVSVPQTIQENGTSVTKMLVPVTAEEKTNKKNDVKARSLLLMALPNEH
ncbi:hypothetical protein Tco_1174417 [Tanacetum coccineum]